MATRKVILDTDIGDDVDDALALGLLLSCPELELVGVTTVFKNVYLRAKLALKVLDAYGRDNVPVIPGIGHRINDDRRAFTHVDHFPKQAEVLRGHPPKANPSEESAVDFIVSTILDSPGEISLLSIGPLTNIAAAIWKQPRIVKAVKEYVMMGGHLGVSEQAQAEWNVRCDPVAAKMVFDSGIPLKMVGLDVTMKCRVRPEDLVTLRSNTREEVRLLCRLIELWQDGDNSRLPILHDPLAAAVLMDASFVETRRQRISVETQGKLTTGFTLPAKDGRAGCDVAVDVESERFLDFFMERLVG
jgi:purine nucleosidase